MEQQIEQQAGRQARNAEPGGLWLSVRSTEGEVPQVRRHAADGERRGAEAAHGTSEQSTRRMCKGVRQHQVSQGIPRRGDGRYPPTSARRYRPCNTCKESSRSDPVVGLALRLLHGRAAAADDERDPRGAGHAPLAAHLLHLFDVDAVAVRGLEQDDRVLRGAFERGLVAVEGAAPPRARRSGSRCARTSLIFPSLNLWNSSPIRGEQALLLDADRGIAEARGELERIDAVRVDDAVHVDVAREAPARGATPSSSAWR